jgi:hypothetical protein
MLDITSTTQRTQTSYLLVSAPVQNYQQTSQLASILVTSANYHSTPFYIALNQPKLSLDMTNSPTPAPRPGPRKSRASCGDVGSSDLHLENREAVVILLKLRTFIKEQVKFSSITLRPSVDLARVRQYYNIVRAFQREQCPTNSLDCFREGSYTVQNKHIL